MCHDTCAVITTRTNCVLFRSCLVPRGSPRVAFHPRQDGHRTLALSLSSGGLWYSASQRNRVSLFGSVKPIASFFRHFSALFSKRENFPRIFSVSVCASVCLCVCDIKGIKWKVSNTFLSVFFFFSYLCFRNNNANGKNTRAQLLEHSLRPLAITLSSPSFLSLSLFLTCFSFFWGQQKTIAEITFAVPNWHCNYWIFLNYVYVCVSVLNYISSIP